MSLDSIKTPSIVFTHKYFNCFPIGIPVGTRLTTDWVKKVFVSKKVLKYIMKSTLVSILNI